MSSAIFSYPYIATGRRHIYEAMTDRLFENFLELFCTSGLIPPKCELFVKQAFVLFSTTFFRVDPFFRTNRLAGRAVCLFSVEILSFEPKLYSIMSTSEPETVKRFPCTIHLQHSRTVLQLTIMRNFGKLPYLFVVFKLYQEFEQMTGNLENLGLSMFSKFGTAVVLNFVWTWL